MVVAGGGGRSPFECLGAVRLVQDEHCPCAPCMWLSSPPASFFFPELSEHCMVLAVVLVLWVPCSGVVLLHFADCLRGSLLSFLPTWPLCAGGRLKVWEVY